MRMLLQENVYGLLKNLTADVRICKSKRVNDYKCYGILKKFGTQQHTYFIKNKYRRRTVPAGKRLRCT